MYGFLEKAPAWISHALLSCSVLLFLVLLSPQVEANIWRDLFIALPIFGSSGVGDRLVAVFIGDTEIPTS